MRSIERRFNTIKSKKAFLGDYSCLVEAVQGQKFSRRRLYTYFKKLVATDDYDVADTNLLVRHLYKISNYTDECTFFNENASQSSQTSEDDNDIGKWFLTHSIEKKIVLV